MLLVAVLVACQPTPDQDSFYTPPSTLPAANGSLIRSRTSTFSVDPAFGTKVPGTSAWQILYKSTSATGTAMAVSSLVRCLHEQK